MINWFFLGRLLCIYKYGFFKRIIWQILTNIKISSLFFTSLYHKYVYCVTNFFGVGKIISQSGAPTDTYTP